MNRRSISGSRILSFSKVKCYSNRRLLSRLRSGCHSLCVDTEIYRPHLQHHLQRLESGQAGKTALTLAYFVLVSTTLSVVCKLHHCNHVRHVLNIVHRVLHGQSPEDVFTTALLWSALSGSVAGGCPALVATSARMGSMLVMGCSRASA